MNKKIKDITKPIPSITHAFAQWDKEQTVADFVKDELMQIDTLTRKSKRATVVDRLVHHVQFAERDNDSINAADLLFKLAGAGDAKATEQPAGGTVNFFQIASDRIDDGVRQLIDLTPKKKIKTGIEGII